MRIRSEDIPQADVLDDVVRAVEAVGQGAETYQDIAHALAKVERQGRYYRRAAEILGFIRNEHNLSELTVTGRYFLDHPEDRNHLLAQAVLRSRLIQRVLPFLESVGYRGASRTQMERFIREVTDPVGESMIPRRVSTIISWLERIRMVKQRDNRFFLRDSLPPGVDIVEYDAPDEPLFPKKYDLNEYRSVAGKVRAAKDYLKILIDEVAHERAEKAHRLLTDLVAAKVRNTGSIPKNNKYVDLSAAIHEDLYLFEMKSTTNANVHAQIRRAISQLYEYRYLQELPNAKLVVVIESPPPKEKKWMVDYVIKDRKMLIAWDGDGKTLSFPQEINHELGFLA